MTAFVQLAGKMARPVWTSRSVVAHLGIVLLIARVAIATYIALQGTVVGEWILRIYYDIFFLFESWTNNKHRFSNRCREPDCKDFGPCYCGVEEKDGHKACKVPYAGQECTS